MLTNSSKVDVATAVAACRCVGVNFSSTNASKLDRATNLLLAKDCQDSKTVKRPSVADFQVIKLDICPSNVDTFPDKALQSVTDFCRASTRSVRPAIAVAFSFAWIGARRMQD